MSFRCIFKLYVYFFLVSAPGLGYSDTTCSQMNVVVFFADSSKIPSSAAGIKFLEMQEMARVKHSFPASRDIHPYVAQRNAMNCKELLHEGLESLTHFCQNALGMKTATVTVSSKSLTNEINNGEPEPSPQIRDRLAQRGTHKFRRSKETNEFEPTVHKSKKAFMRDVVTSPEHTEVFNIRVKRDGSEYGSESREIADVPLGREKSKPPWDVLDVMSHVKFSFFGNLFEDEKKKKLSKEENEILTNVIGQRKQDPGLFESVKSTLCTLQETPGEPFLMVVFGGHLSEICDKHSALVQSLKHVVESTDPKKTLIVLTGACPEGKCDNRRDYDNTVVIKESFNPDLGKEERNSVLPVYARDKGKCNEFAWQESSAPCTRTDRQWWYLKGMYEITLGIDRGENLDLADPEEWKKTPPCHYKPIALPPIIFEVTEKATNMELIKNLEKLGIINDRLTDFPSKINL